MGPPATLTSITPPDGGAIAVDGTLTIKFDNPVKADTEVLVNGTPAKGSGTSWVWEATGLTPGSWTITIEWTNDDGSTGKYTITLAGGEQIPVADLWYPGGINSHWVYDYRPAF